MGLFDKFSAFIEQLPKALENLSSAIRAAQKSDPHHGDVDPLRVQAQIRFADADVAEHRANQNEQTSIQRSIKRAAWFTFFAAFAYAGISFCQWQDAHKQMRIDQRAWIYFKPDFQASPQLVVNAPFAVEVKIENIGKTAAKKLSAIVVVERLAPHVGASFLDDIWKKPADTISTGVLFPNDKTIKFTPRWIVFDSLTQKLEPGITSDVDVRDWDNGKFYFAVYGKITYVDIFGTQHWTTFCATAVGGKDLPTKEVTTHSQACVENYNDADNNE